MAFKQVVSDKFFLKTIAFLQALEEEYGPITLGMIDSAYVTGPVRWNLSVAARWLDDMPQRSATQLVMAKASAFFGESTPRFAAISVRRTNDYLVKTLVPLLDIEELGTAYRFEALELSMFNMDEVVVFIANPAQLLISVPA